MSQFAGRSSDTGEVTARDIDADLVARAAAGDDRAVAELYQRHAGAGLRAARAVTRNGDDAEDALSDAFVAILQAFGARRLGADVAFRPYLLTASRHAAVDVVRRTTRCRPVGNVDELDRPAGGDLPGARLIDEVDTALVERVFRDLPPRWQTVLLLVEVHGLPVRQAAALLGLSANGTAQLAVRARAGLRRRFLRASELPAPRPAARR